MFQVKICGITSAEDAAAAAAAGADAVGLNFYSGSPRSVTVEDAAQILAAVPGGVCKVGVFVNPSAAVAAELHDRLGLDLIQLHGDESPELLRELRGRPVLRAFRAAPGGLPAIEEYLAACRRLECLPWGLLVDGYRPGEYGGTGQTADWEALGAWNGSRGELRLVLAGGLTAANVAQAIRAVRPAAVDTASGVEVSCRQKDAGKMAAFVAAARAAFGALGGERRGDLHQS